MAPALLVLTIAATIFSLSAQPHSAESTVRFFGQYNWIARKAAHFSEYAVFAATLLFVGIRLLPNLAASPTKLALIALCLCSIYAASDEFHQIFVPGRTPLFTDVLLDTFGSACTCLTFLVWRKLRT